MDLSSRDAPSGGSERKADPFTRRESERFTDALARRQDDLGDRVGVDVYFCWLRWRWHPPSEREPVEWPRLVTIVTAREGAMDGAAE